MWTGVKVLTKPGAQPFELDDLKRRLVVDHNDDNGLLQQFLAGAVARIDGPNGIGVAMMVQTWRKTYDSFPHTIVLPGAPIKSVTEIKYLDTAGAEQTLPVANYRIAIDQEPVRIEPAVGCFWPSTRHTIGSVWIDYVVGETDAANVEPDLLDAVALLVAHRYDHRGATVMKSTVEIPFGFSEIVREHVRIHFAA